MELREPDSLNFDTATERLTGDTTLSDTFETFPNRQFPVGSWLGVKLVNAGTDSGEWRLDTQFALWEPNTKIYSVHPNRTRLIFKSNWQNLKISDRLEPERVNSSAPIILSPGESAEIWINFEVASISQLGIQLLTPEDLLKSRTQWSVRFGVYIGIGFALIGFLWVFSLLLRFPPAFYFSVFFGLSVLLFIAIEGYFFYYLHPNAPGLNKWVVLLIRFFMALAYLQFARSFLNPRGKFPRFEFALKTFLGLAIILLVLNLVAYGPIAIFLMVIGTIFYIILIFWAAILAMLKRISGAPLFFIGTMLFVASSTQLILVVTGVTDITLRESNDRASGLGILHGVVFSAALVTQAFGLRKERDQALATELETSKKNLKIANSLIDAERDRDRARSLAERNRARLATASHDLRQPLTSLKLALEEFHEETPRLKPKLSASLDYLNSILGSSLSDTRQTEEDHHHSHPTDEPVPLAVVFTNLDRMFAAEAKAKSLELIFEKTDIIVQADVVSLIRSMSNLVSNAIKYTPSGSIAVGVELDNDYATLVVTDTGLGMDKETLKRVMNSYERANDDVDGEGLGLSIAAELARNQGWSFETQSEPDQGSSFRIGNISIIPAA
ncbi:MAG: sensor histidine kinase [Hellea sp.]